MRKLIILLVLLSCMTLFAGCDKENAKTDAKPPVTQTQVQPKPKQNVVIYRASADGTEMLLPEKLSLEDNGKPAMENALVALLSTKPQDAKYADVIPVGTKLLSLKVEKGIAYADFSKELVRKGQSASSQMLAMYGIVNTLTEFSEVKKVQILVEGKKVVSGQLDLEEPLARNNTLLPKGKN